MPTSVTDHIDVSDFKDITQLLHNFSDTDEASQRDLLNAVYRDLHAIASRKMSRESADHTLQATALINEAYPQLMKADGLQWRDRRHFLGAAAEAMRRVLIDHARRKSRIKRGGQFHQVELSPTFAFTSDNSEELLALNRALESLEQIAPLRASVVKLKFFAGLSNSDVAESLELSLRTVERHWTFAKTWLRREMADAQER